MRSVSTSTRVLNITSSTLLLLIVGCGGLAGRVTDGLQPVTIRDSGSPTVEMDAGVEPPLRDLILTSHLSFASDSPDAGSYGDNRALSQVTARWRTRDGGWASRTAVPFGDGGVRLADIPAGDVMVFTSVASFVTSEDWLDLGFVFQGRSTAPDPGPGTSVRFEYSAVPPWIPGELIEVFSREGGVTTRNLPPNPPIVAGITAFNWGPITWDRWSLLSGAAGDRIGACILSERVFGSLAAKVAGVCSSALAPEQVDQALTRIPIVFAPTPSVSINGRIDFTSFEATLREARAASPITKRIVSLVGVKDVRRLGRADRNLRGAEAYVTLLRAENVPSAQPTLQSVLEFADVIPRDDLIVDIVMEMNVLVSSPAGTEAFPVYAERASLIGPNGFDLHSRLSPVRNVTVNGDPANTARIGIGRTPRIAWEPPSRGTVTRYGVTIWDFGDPNFDFSLLTTKTFVEVPPGFLQLGRSYVAIIAAESGNFDPRNPLFRPGNRETARTITEAFVP